ncbi:MAG: hypothetical protein IJQ07_05770 [Clostridia bacterium]|nr:hypothetical protein [Clostridia bacterium]
MKHLIGGKGNFYKANLHTHTTVSDGQFSPEEIKTLYLEKGYSIVAYTDHNVIVAHNDLSDDKFLAITGVEMNIDAPDKADGDIRRMKTYHINFYSKDRNKTVSAVFNDCNISNSVHYVTDEMRAKKFDAKYSIESINEIIRLMHEDGFLVMYNHPRWSLQRYHDYIDLKRLWGIEVYNTGCDIITTMRETDTPFEDLLLAGNFVVPIADDDTHGSADLFGGFSIIEAKKLEYDEILSAMGRGDIYSSTGPLIHELSIDNNFLTIKCDSVKRIFINSERRWGRSMRGENITCAKFDISDFFEYNKKYNIKNSFIRITIEDNDGYKAWTRAYSQNELE